MKFGNAVVTGGAGFLGSRLVERIMPMCDRVIVLDDLSTGNRSAVPRADHVQFVEGSITDERLLERVLPGADYVFHLACANLVQSADDLERDFRVNLFGGFTLLRKTKELCPKLSRFLYTSTASVYGNADRLPTPETDYKVALPYSASKFGMEHYCHVYGSMFGLPVTIARLSNVYGPGQTPRNPYCGVVSKFFTAIERGEPLLIYGDGTQTRDFTFVEDAMDAILLLAGSPATAGGVYNVGTGVETPVVELAARVARAAGFERYPTEHRPPRSVDKVYRRVLDISKIHADTGWKPARSMDEGLAAALEWLRKGGPQA